MFNTNTIINALFKPNLTNNETVFHTKKEKGNRFSLQRNFFFFKFETEAKGKKFILPIKMRKKNYDKTYPIVYCHIGLKAHVGRMYWLLCIEGGRVPKYLK